MRVEAASHAYRNSDRSRREETRADADDRRNQNNDRRAQHASIPWIMAPLATQLISQVTPHNGVWPDMVIDAYARSETLTRLTPRVIKVA